MADDLDTFFQCLPSENGWTFFVAVVEWNGHEPCLDWKPFRQWVTEPDSKRLQKATAAAKNHPRFFRTCIHCEELCNSGHMHSRDTCQSCAQREYGILY